MRPGRYSLALLVVVLGSLSCGQAPPVQDAFEEIEDEVLANIRGQAVSDHSLADFALPESFLRRVADRIVRSSYLSRYRNVVGDLQPDGPAPEAAGAGSGTQPFDELTRVPATPEPVTTYRRKLRPGRPELRGYRVPLLRTAGDPWPFHGAAANRSATLSRATSVVGRRLATDGLIQTLAAVLAELDDERMLAAGASEMNLLREIGLPTDWLAFFHAVDEPAAGATDGAQPNAAIDRSAMLVRAVARRVLGEDRVKPESLASMFRFGFEPSHPNFRVAVESGSEELGLLRLQLTRGDYWAGSGDGGSVDIARQLMTQLAGTRFLVSIEPRFVPLLQDLASTWGVPESSRGRLLEADGPISQWAQDNGKAGILAGRGHGPSVAATLTPRYASRREDGSEFLPAESFLLETLAASGHPVVQSPLLFQGGDLLAVRDPGDDERVLFIGEAEIHRNTALGLDRGQVLEAFRIEFSVDRCEVLPSISFHIDFDVTFREYDGRLVAFVNDREAGARILIEQALDALVLQGTLDTAAAATAREHLRLREDRKAVDLIAAAIAPHVPTAGTYSAGLARGFEDGAPQSAVANLQRFLLALDILRSASMTERQLRGAGHERAYFRSLRRQRALRGDLARHLTGLGYRVVPVPGFSEGEYSVSYINGIQARGLYLMPAYGGFLEQLDAAAREVFERELGDGVDVSPIYCPESQRRLGGLHCSVAAYPTVNRP